MLFKKDDLLNKLQGRPILIWGSRMTGIGFARFAGRHGFQVIGFIDSDRALRGKKVHNLPIYQPDNIASWKNKFDNLAVVVAVSIKEDEIVGTLEGMGLTVDDYVRYSDHCGHFYTIDVSGTCNLKCPSCAHTLSGVKNKKGFMAVDDFKKIIDKILKENELVTHISLYSWGEPFLHPQLNHIIEHAHSKGIATAVSTNLSIASSAQIKKIVKASPDYLKISLSGFYPGIYNTTHSGGDVNLVKSNLYKIKYFIDKFNSSIFVDVNYHLYKNNTGIDRSKMQELCHELGYTLSSCYANITPIERLISYCEGHLDDKTEKFLELLLVSIDKGLEITRAYRNLPCRFLTNQININWDRSVPLCCVCYDRKTSTISNDYLQDSLEDIIGKKKNHSLCQKCQEYGFPPYLLGVNQKEWDNEAGQMMWRSKRKNL